MVIRGPRPCTWLLVLVLAVIGAGPARATLVQGRVVDVMQGQVHAGAHVQARRALGSEAVSVATDPLGFFQLELAPAGAYLLTVTLADGRQFLARLLVLPGRRTQIVDLDFSRSSPPDDDEDY